MRKVIYSVKNNKLSTNKNTGSKDVLKFNLRENMKNITLWFKKKKITENYEIF